MADPDNIDVIVLVIAATYVLAAFNAVLAIQSSRTPQGATAWSIALISLPFLALPLYWVFGRSKFQGYVEAFNMAQSRIWIANPYFVPDEPTAKAMELAALRGVDVRIILPANNDNRLVQLAAMTYIDQLQPSGVKFFFYGQGTKGFLHEKVFLVDDRLSAVGTTNLDNRSLHINFECSALVVDREFARRVEAMFLSDFANSTPMKQPVFEEKARWHRLAAKTANLAAPML